MSKITIFVALLFNVFVYAQSFSLDQTFGDNGVKINAGIDYTPKDVLLIDNNYYFISYNSLAKVSYDGIIDTTFGNNGFLTLENGSDTFNINGFKNIGDYFYVFGYATNNTSDNENIFICKIDMDGNFDTSFGTNNFTIIDFSQSESLNDFTIDANGNLFCVGNRNVESIYFKITPSGTLDTTFDDTGYKFISSTYGKNIFNYESNFLLVGAYSGQLVLSQIDANGNLITSYGTNGIITTELMPGFSSSIVQAKLVGNHIFVNSFHAYSFITQLSQLQKIDIATGNVLSNFTNIYETYFQIKDDNIYITGAYRCDSNCPRDFNLIKQSLNGDSEPQNTINYTYDFPALLWSNDASYTVVADNNGKISVAGIGRKSYLLNGQAVYEWGFAIIRLVEGPLSLDDVSTKTTSIYPNPFNDFVTVESASLIKDIQVIDVSGRVISTPNFTMEGETARVNLETLQQSGIYLMQVTTIDNKTFTRKIVKQ